MPESLPPAAPPPPASPPAPRRRGRRWGATPLDAPLELVLSLPDLLREPDARARWTSAFGEERPLRVEIGVGNSDFLLEVALREPRFSYLGFEYALKRVVKVHKRILSRGLTNIRLLRENALRVIPALLEPATVDRFFVNFPDPWPKRRHAKNRLVRPAAAELFARLLLPGGGISLRSDSPSYAAQMLAVLDAVPALENLAGAGRFSGAPREEIPTSFEMRFRSEGRRIHYLEYRKKG